jgi:hypothetical protein
VDVEWLILADSAQVNANKLYLLGGGWDRLTVNKDFPFNQHCAIALSVKVPWNDTNQKHTFEIEVLSEDQNMEEQKNIAKIQGQFEVGRPAGIPAGQDQRIQLAIDMGLKIDCPGTKVIIARIGGIESKRLYFNVLSTKK